VAVSDELVKDPVCQTYVVRSRAVRGRGADDAPYFCSEECARRYAG
jgi:YHS domain-containing protein